MYFCEFILLGIVPGKWNSIKCKPKKIPVIICKIIVIPKKKPRFQKEFIWRGQGYDCKCDFISNTKYNFQEPILIQIIIPDVKKRKRSVKEIYIIITSGPL